MAIIIKQERVDQLTRLTSAIMSLTTIGKQRKEYNHLFMQSHCIPFVSLYYNGEPHAQLIKCFYWYSIYQLSGNLN